MSHISKVQMRIDDLDALADAAEALGLELRRDQKQWKYYAGKKSKCHAAIVDASNPAAYEVGVVAVDGQYELAHDDYAGGMGMVAKTGRACKRLLVEYGVAKTKRLARAKGWRYREERRENGEVKCYVTPPGNYGQSKAATTGKRW